VDDNADFSAPELNLYKYNNDRAAFATLFRRSGILPYLKAFGNSETRYVRIKLIWGKIIIDHLLKMVNTTY